MKSCGQAVRCGYYGNDLLQKSVESSWTWFWPDFSVKSNDTLLISQANSSLASLFGDSSSKVIKLVSALQFYC